MLNRYLERPPNQPTPPLMKAIGCLLTLPILALIGILMSTLFLVHPIAMEHALPHPIPMPDLPEKLTALPAQAHTECQDPEDSGRDSDSAEDSVSIWTYPGKTPPRNDNSNFRPPVAEYGPERGQLARCADVKVTDWAWSEFDGAFLVWVEVADSTSAVQDSEAGEAADSAQASGWIQFGELDFR